MNTFHKSILLIVAGAMLVLAVAQLARADDNIPPIDSPHWMHGMKAIMDVYTIDTTTLDVIATNEFAFATADACASAMARAMSLANQQVPKGAIAVVKCFAASKSAAGEVKPSKSGSTEL